MPTCYLIGEDILTQECAEMLLKRQWGVFGIVTEKPCLIEWAKGKDIQVINIRQFSKEVAKKSFDFLFSVVNSKILSQDLLELPKEMPINFHGASFKYAGRNGVSHALLDETETEYGIVWHEMEEKVDSGRVLAEKIFSIGSGDTAYSLMLKSAKLGLEAFETLLAKLETHAENAIPTSLFASTPERNFYYSTTLPASLGILDWKNSGEKLNRICRAFYYADLSNPFFVPKIRLGKQVYFVFELVLTDRKSFVNAGEIVAISDTEWVVATATVDVKIHEIVDEFGDRKGISDLKRKYGLDVGSSLLDLSLTDDQSLRSSFQKALRNEHFWVGEYESSNFAHVESLPQQYGAYASQKQTFINFDDALFSRFDREESDVMFAMIVLYLRWIVQENNLTVLFSAIGDNDYLQSILPFHLKIGDQDTFLEVVDKIISQEAKITGKGSHLKELFLKHSELKDLKKIIQESVYIQIGNDFHEDDLSQGQGVTFSIFKNARQIKATSNSNLLLTNMGQHFQRINEIFAEKGNAPINEVDFLPESEIGQLLLWNSTKKEYPSEGIYRLFENRVREYGDRVALYYQGEALTYGELSEKVTLLAAGLEKYLGETDRKVIISLCLPRSTAFIIGLLAVLKLQHVVFIVGSNLSDKESISKIDRYSPRLVIFERDSSCDHLDHLQETTELRGISVAKLSVDPIASQRDFTDCVLLTTTSGTTGTPKGIVTRSAGWTNWSHYLREENFIDSQSVVYSSCPSTFDASFWEDFCLALTQGASLVINPDIERLSIPHLRVLFLKHQVTVATFTPSVFSKLSPEEFLTLKRVFVIGETLKPTIIKRWLEKGVEIVNGYGPSEVCAGATLSRCQPNQSITIGRPIANTEIHILDEKQKLRPIGQSGEIYIAGVGASSNYLNCSEAEQQRFTTVTLHGKSLNVFRTGDWARYLPDGQIEFGGRIKGDRQEKIRGFRIELDAIEACLSSHEAVSQVHVCVVDELSGKRLVAYVVCENNRLYDFRGYLFDKGFPPQALPTVYCLDQMPLDRNGKLNVKELVSRKSFFDDSLVSERELSELESKLVAILEQFITSSKEMIYFNASFRSAGGDSLTYMSLIEKINNELFSGKNELLLSDMEIDFTFLNLVESVKIKKENLTFRDAQRYTSRFSLKFFEELAIDDQQELEKVNKEEEEEDIIIDFYRKMGAK